MRVDLILSRQSIGAADGYCPGIMLAAKIRGYIIFVAKANTNIASGKILYEGEAALAR